MPHTDLAERAAPEARALPAETDVAVIGAGFSGMYLIQLLRAAGLRVAVLEKGADLGGTWYWNRYPGARCDIESVQYAHSYLPDLQQDWDWSERYATQAEILRYANALADRTDLRRDIWFNRQVTAAKYDEAARRWDVTCQTGEEMTARFLIFATGCLSQPNEVAFPGRDSFAGPIYQTGLWPHEGADFTGQRVAVIGTGSSGIQAIPVIAEQASVLTVFQRTPNYAVPAHNRALTDQDRAAVKASYPDLRARQKQSTSGTDYNVPADAFGAQMTPEARREMMERRWAEGGLVFGACFLDQMFDRTVNEEVAEFVRDKIRARVNDPAVAELLCPTNTIGAKRLCVENGYYETFNLPHVTLVDVSQNPLSLVPEGVSVAGQTYPADCIVCATGFDAMTGAILKVDVAGRGGRRLKDHWQDGPRTYLGLGVAGFPNMFTVTGPQSPSVFTNVTQSIEQHCEWITRCLAAMAEAGETEIEAEAEAEAQWLAHNAEVAAKHLRSSTASWYTGENIAGKPVTFMPYIGGLNVYAAKCEEVAAAGYRGFVRR